MKWDTRALRFLVAIPGETPLTQMVARPISARAAHAESVNAPSAETFAPRSVSLNFKPTSAPQHKHLSSGCLNVSCRHRHNASSHPKRIRTFCPLRLGPGIPVWCGGMLEAGVGRAHNIHLASLRNFLLPGDTSSSSRYFKTDIVNEPLETEGGLMPLPSGPGIGVTLNRDFLSASTSWSIER